ncbi:AraC family transcriptional regulator [Sciscionella sediminilitoris]|uniref:AraC family transcriptional regulator n=1 Tax=Sciscionella sediminilitoris TaxID=1445613 RepID=UPI00068BA23F|nr:AraC family transcriptional regulator [Sciscionella sp. SE31]
MSARDEGSAWWNYPRSTATTRHILDTAAAHGLAEPDCLSGTGLTPDFLRSQDALIEGYQELIIVRNLIRRLGAGGELGIETGQRFTFSSSGPLGFALLSCPTIREAIEIGERFTRLSGSFHRFTTRRTDADIVLVFDGSDIPADVRMFFCGRDFAGFIHILSVLSGGGLPKFDARVRTRLPRLPETAGKVLTTTRDVLLDSASDEVALPLGYLELPIPTADRDMLRYCVEQCERMLESRTAVTGLTWRIRSILHRDLSAPPDMRAVAGELAMTDRTLHRHLSAEATSFRAIVREVRKEAATELLEAGHSISEVARRLGYSDVTSFSHAYRRWFGRAPRNDRSIEVPPRS